MRTLYLCGAGNSEGVRLALLINEQQDRWERIVLLDDDPAKHAEKLLGIEIIGAFSLLADADPETSEIVNLVARTTAGRARVRERLEAYGLPFATLVHPGVDLLGAELAREVIVYQNATVGPEVRLADGSVVFMGAVVGHESQIARGCVMAANSVLNARVELGEGVYIGTNSTVLPEVKIGAGATVGAGSVVIEDVPAGATVMGVPARLLTPTRAVSKAAPKGAPANRTSANAACVDPDVERTICKIWQTLLELPSVALDQNFFDLGGQSLLALRMRELVERETGFALSIADVFEFPTVRTLARHVSARAGEPSPRSTAQDRAARRRAMTPRRRSA